MGYKCLHLLTKLVVLLSVGVCISAISLQLAAVVGPTLATITYFALFAPGYLVYRRIMKWTETGA
jgi:hypothetical protein